MRPRALVFAALGLACWASVAVARGRTPNALHQLAESSGCLGVRPGCVPARGMDAPEDLAVSPDGRNVYTATEGYNALNLNAVLAIATFRRDPSTGMLTQLPGSDGCVTREPTASCLAIPSLTEFWAGPLAVSPDGRDLYVAGDDVMLVFARDPQTGALSALPAPAGCMTPAGIGGCTPTRDRDPAPAALAFSPDGGSVYAIESKFGELARLDVYHRDPNSGALRPLAGPSGCAAAPDDRAVRAGRCQRLPVLNDPDTITVSHDGRFVLVSDHAANAIVTLPRDRVTGGFRRPRAASACIESPSSGRLDRGCRRMRGVDLLQDMALARDGRSVYLASSGHVGIGADSPFAATVIALRREPRTGRLTQLNGRAGCFATSEGARCRRARGLSRAEYITIAPDGTEVYAIGDAIVAFARGARTSALRQPPSNAGCYAEDGQGGCTPIRGLRDFGAAALSADSKSLYVASPHGDALSVFARAP